MQCFPFDFRAISLKQRGTEFSKLYIYPSQTSVSAVTDDATVSTCAETRVVTVSVSDSENVKLNPRDFGELTTQHLVGWCM